MVITINLEKLTLRDLITIEDAQHGEGRFSDAVLVLDKATEEDILDLPLTQLQELLDALSVAMDAASNPETDEGN